MENARPRPIRCKAAVCRGPGEALAVEEVVVDAPRAYEIRIKIICASLCHTDIAFWRDKVPEDFPRILGHEAYGLVESVGERVEGFAAGDAVVPTFLGQCGRCSSCSSERTNMCTDVPFSRGSGMRRGAGGDGGARFRDGRGAAIRHCFAVSSFSQYAVVDVNQVVRVGAAVPPRLACLLSCGAATGVGAAWRLAKVEPGSSVAIFGLGTVGLAVAQGAKMCGASRIIGVDVNPDKEEVGKAFGVTDFINPSQLGENHISEVTIAMTGGGADYAFECAGVSAAMTDAFRSTRPGTGTTVILGVDDGGEPVRLPAVELLYGKRVMGSLFGGIKPKTDIPILAQMCIHKELDLEGLVTHEVGLQEINMAFDLLLQGKSLRCIIWMDEHLK
ncbi:hypothetical protein ACP4OV_015930 [Aristida adscensionis]